MSTKKAFWLSLAITLACLMPIYIFFAIQSIYGAAAPADNATQDIPMARPTSADCKNLLVITSGDESSSFCLIRFDALKSEISTVAFDFATVLVCDGLPVTLGKSLSGAGPEQCKKALEETLGITIDNYLYCTKDILCEISAPLGSTGVRLANYLTPEALGQLKLLIPGCMDVELSPIRLADILSSGVITGEGLTALRADGYLAFLKAQYEDLQDIIPAAFKKYSQKTLTDISATQIYDYERTLRFLARHEPSFKTGTLSGIYANDKFELSADARSEIKVLL